MAVLVVEHDTERPGLDCMVAGALAEALGLPVARLGGQPAAPDEAACQHVLGEGALAPNGLLWLERANPAPLLADVLLGERSDPAVAVISVNRCAVSAEEVAALYQRLGRDAITCRVVELADGRFDVRSTEPDGPLLSRPLARDTYGRMLTPLPDDLRPDVRHRFPETPQMASNPRTVSATAHLGVFGRARQMRDGYPGVLAAVGDAADAAGYALTISFLPPDLGVEADTWSSALHQLDGLILPGASDAAAAEPQIAAAAAGLAADLPVLGLCLGMQSMTVAVLRERADLAGAGLEEENPNAAVPAFRRLRDEAGRPWHRLGRRRLRLWPGSLVERCYGQAGVSERLHHRYRLDPVLIPVLAEAGLFVTAVDAGDTSIADAVEVPDRRFFLGLQGHPELSSRLDRPHPVFLAFLAAVARKI